MMNDAATLGEILIGNSALLVLAGWGICWFFKREMKRIEGRIDNHEERCKERWQKNWADHDEFREDIGKLKGKLDVD